MKAVITDGQGKLWIEEIPKPKIGDYDALVKIEACAFCNSTDRQIINGNFLYAKGDEYPVILGHESVGSIIDLFSKVKKYKVGDHVLHPNAEIEGWGHMWGGFAEYGSVTDFEAWKADHPDQIPGYFWPMQQTIPDWLGFEKATLIITLRETWSWLNNIGLDEKCHTAAVIGTGPVGLCFVRWLKLRGVESVFAIGRRTKTLNLARTMGADDVVDTRSQDPGAELRKWTNNCGVDFIISAVSSKKVVGEAVGWLSEGGRIAAYGSPDADEKSAGLLWGYSPTSWSLHYSVTDEPAAHEEILEIVSAGEINLESLISDIYQIDQVEEAYQQILNKKAIKVVIRL
jgi:L-iditol 2-dehydrogenase/propanol-preferring alcohol dehydrogenase